MIDDESGSTIPLILGFFMLAALVIAGAVAAGDAFVQQRGLQAVCDGAAVAAAAGAADLNRAADVGPNGSLRFAGAQEAVETYLARDPGRRTVQVTAQVSTDARTLELTCVETRRITFGAVFGRADGVRHVARSSARAPLAG